jgi:hypothetical protein
MRRIAPAQVEQPGRVDAGATDCVDDREIACQQLFADRLLERRAEILGQRLQGLGQMLRHQVFRWRVDQIAGQGDRFHLLPNAISATEGLAPVAPWFVSVVCSG